VIDWSRDELSRLTKKGETGCVYFYTPLCGTCQVASRMLQVIEQLVQVPIGKINLNFYPDIANNFAIESVPCLIIVKDGQVVETIYAFHSVPYLLEKIKHYAT
jgi:thioredoxin-like negative regulator of GroEL